VGSRFWFTLKLPVHDAPLPSQVVPQAAANPRPLAGIHLLLAEDNIVNQQIAVELLSRRGATVDVVGNGREAVNNVFAGRRYDAILMDVHMPVLDGLAATRLLRSGFDAQGLPIIAMTANAMDSDRQACLAAGMNSHVAKPFVIDELVTVILRHVTGAGAAPAQPAADAAPAFHCVWDRRTALAQLGGDESLLQVILPVFLRNLDSAAGELSRFATLPADRLADLMHSLKGMGANVGAQALAAVSGQAEAQLRSDAHADAGGWVRQVLDAVAAVRVEVESACRQS
jgi:CheY-like chemotaxis protein